MSSLAEHQRHMADFMLDRRPADDVVGLFVNDHPIAVVDRLRVHRNNLQLGLIDPLAANFPVVRALVGVEFFEAMALDFIRAMPPRRPQLILFGQELPGFIASYSAAAPVPYLADMARLELALVVAENATEADPLDPSALQIFDPDQLEDLKLATHPSLRFVVSDFPLLAIWQAHQGDPETIPPIDLGADGVMLLVYRPHQEVLIRAVSAGAFAFVMALTASQTLANAYRSAIANHPDFALPEELAALLAAEIFIEATL